MNKQSNITNWDNVPIIFDVPMAARILGRTPDSIARRCKRGDFSGCAFKDGDEWRFEKEAFQQHIRRNSVAQVGAAAK